MVKNLPGMQETRVRSLSQEDPLENEMATHSSVLAWRTAWTEEPGRLWPMGSQRVGHRWRRLTPTIDSYYTHQRHPPPQVARLYSRHWLTCLIQCKARWKLQHVLCCAWLPSRVQLFATPWTAAHQAPLSMRILQARVLEWVAMPSSRGSSQSRDWNCVSLIAGGFFNN